MKTYRNGVPVWWLLVLFLAFIAGSMVGMWMVSAATKCGLMVGT